MDDIEGSASEENVTAATSIKKGKGRFARLSVTTAGSTVGSVYDAASAARSPSASRTSLRRSPTRSASIEIKIPVEDGIVVTPGTRASI
jgi:hypothetical protein